MNVYVVHVCLSRDALEERKAKTEEMVKETEDLTKEWKEQENVWTEMQAACNRISGEEIHQLHDEERQLRVSIEKLRRQVEEGRQKVDDYESALHSLMVASPRPRYGHVPSREEIRTLEQRWHHLQEERETRRKRRDQLEATHLTILDAKSRMRRVECEMEESSERIETEKTLQKSVSGVVQNILHHCAGHGDSHALALKLLKDHSGKMSLPTFKLTLSSSILGTKGKDNPISKGAEKDAKSRDEEEIVHPSVLRVIYTLVAKKVIAIDRTDMENTVVCLI
jgi:hypothetical protein